MENINYRFKKVLVDFGIKQSKLTDSADYYFDLNLDMLDLMVLAKKLKDEFLVDIPDNEVLRMERISDTLYFIKQKYKPVYLFN